MDTNRLREELVQVNQQESVIRIPAAEPCVWYCKVCLLGLPCNLRQAADKKSLQPDS